MTLFALGAIDPLLVDQFGGFDRPGFIQQVRLLSDGDVGPHEVLQSGGTPGRTARVTGTLQTAGELALLRGYHTLSTVVGFIDGNAAGYNVVVAELSIEDMTQWWRFNATLICTDADTVSGS